MKKKIISIMLAFAMLCAIVPCVAMAEDVASGKCGTDVTWTLDDSGTLTISGSGEIYINSSNELNNYKAEIKKIVVESGITYADFHRLSECSLMTVLEISDTVTEIDFPNDNFPALTVINVSADNATFSSKDGLLLDKSGQTLIQYPVGRNDLVYTIPEDITCIGSGAFSKSKLTKILIPDFVTEIKPAFKSCTALTEIEVSENNANYCSVDGVLFDKAKESILAYPSGKQQTSYTIPETVTKIGWTAFAGSDNIETVVIPDTVRIIDGAAFADCTSLVNITLPETLETISGWLTFEGCAALKSMTIPEGITTVVDSMFYECTSLESVILPQSITEIEEEAFYGCTALKKLKIPSSVNSIGRGAFYGCSALESITIPYGVEKIKTETFYNCTSLKSVSIPSSVSVIDQYAFYRCESLESISLPEGVTKLNASAFEKCDVLNKIKLPNSLTYIGECVFDGCYELSHVYYNGTEKEWKKIRIDEYGNKILLDMADIHYDAKPIINGTPAITAEGNTYTATVPLKNVAVDCQLISVLYNDGIMKAIESKSIPLNAESESISVSADEADQIKLFIWDSLSGAVPMCGGYSETIVKE